MRMRTRMRTATLRLLLRRRRHGTLQPHEHAIAHAALRDRVIGPRLRRALDRLVPSQLSEAAFWDNFFSHVDVIKVRLVTDYLTAQDGVRSERTTKHEGWVQLYEAMEPEMRADVRQAAERIAARQKPPPPSAVELAMGIDSSRSNKRWQPDGEQWLKYVEDGPSDIERVLRAAIAPPPAQAPAADVIAGIKQATVDISDPPAGAPAASTAGSTLPGYTPERVLREPLAGGQLSAEEEKDLLRVATQNFETPSDPLCIPFSLWGDHFSEKERFEQPVDARDEAVGVHFVMAVASGFAVS